MKIGMLWFDNDPSADLKAKIERAATYYHRKYGQAPNFCFVHPSMISSEASTVKEIEVRTSRSVMPNHIWIGVNGKSHQPSAG